MQHRKLDRLMTPVERIARVAAAGLTSATSSATKPSGAKSYDNADGTRTIIGNVANGDSNPSYTMATHVGDVTAPGTPTGVTASSKSGVVVVEWDGTLTGGVPDDFFAVRVYLDGSELGILTGAGSVSSASLEGGTTHSVTATAEDDACLPDGTPAHNVSAATAAISVTVSEGVESVAAIAQEALDVAEATGQHFWSDSDGIHVTEVTEEEWGDSADPNYHSGANVLLNALGQLFRDGLNNLLAILPTGIAIYDGNGNAQSNIVASFTQSLVELGKNATTSAIEFCGGIADLAYRGTSAILRSKTGSAGIQSGTGDLYSTTQAALMASSLDGLYDGITHIDLHTAKPRLYAIADSVYLLDTSDPYTLRAEVDMSDLIHAFTTVTHNVTLSNITFSTAPVLYLQRRGNLVSAKMMSVVNARTANSQIYVGTIPTGFRPTSNVAQTGLCVSNNNFNGNYKWIIDSLGGVTYLTSVTGAREAPLVMMWFTTDDWQEY